MGHRGGANQSYSSVSIHPGQLVGAKRGGGTGLRSGANQSYSSVSFHPGRLIGAKRDGEWDRVSGQGKSILFKRFNSPGGACRGETGRGGSAKPVEGERRGAAGQAGLIHLTIREARLG